MYLNDEYIEIKNIHNKNITAFKKDWCEVYPQKGYYRPTLITKSILSIHDILVILNTDNSVDVYNIVNFNQNIETIYKKNNIISLDVSDINDLKIVSTDKIVYCDTDYDVNDIKYINLRKINHNIKDCSQIIKAAIDKINNIGENK